MRTQFEIGQKVKSFWYRDNWTGKRREFNSLADAKRAARKEYGCYISIYNLRGECICLHHASGYTPA